MKFLVISDTHGRRDLVEELLSMHQSRDGLLFLGDGIRDVSPVDCSEGGKLFGAVRGNCDMLSTYEGYEYPEELFLRLDEYNVIMMHGHTHGVKSGIDRAVAYAAGRGADVLLYGHTHVPMEKYFPAGTEMFGMKIEKPIWVFNPGSLGAYGDGGHSFGLLQIRKGQILLSHGKI